MSNIPLWFVPSYSHDRRAHRHRCWLCNRVLQAGDRAWMARTGYRVTKAVHANCADAPHGGAESYYSTVEALGIWAAQSFNCELTERQALAIARAAIAKATGQL